MTAARRGATEKSFTIMLALKHRPGLLALFSSSEFIHLIRNKQTKKEKIFHVNFARVATHSVRIIAVLILLGANKQPLMASYSLVFFSHVKRSAVRPASGPDQHL